MTTVLLGCANRRTIMHWRKSLEGGYEIEVATDLRAVLERCGSGHGFPLVAIDYELLAGDYEEGLSRLQHGALESKILLIGRKCSREIQLVAFSRGVPGYMEADLRSDLLQKGVDRMLNGEVWVERHLVTSLLHILRKKNVERGEISIPENLRNLTPREVEIAMRVCQGESNKRIANRLDITERTVKAHLSSIFKKLEVIDRLQLALQLKDHLTLDKIDNGGNRK